LIDFEESKMLQNLEYVYREGKYGIFMKVKAGKSEMVLCCKTMAA
jgi:hypothetical protein